MITSLTRALTFALLFANVAFSAFAATTDYPSKPVRLLVPFPPGGGADAMARIITPKLTERMGQTWVVDNRGGAGGNMATEVVATALPDGYSVLLGFNTALAANPALYKLPFNVLRDLQPVTKLAGGQYVLVLHPSVPAQTLKDFIALAKAQPGKLNYSSAGIGSPLHLAAEMFKFRTGLNLVHVPYKGGGPAVTALRAGEAGFNFGPMPATMSLVQSGRLKALAVSSTTRSNALPNVPTVNESGAPGYSSIGWFGLMAPKGTPRDIVLKLNAAAARAISAPDAAKQLLQIGADPTVRTPEAFGEFVREDNARYGKLVREAGIKLE